MVMPACKTQVHQLRSAGGLTHYESNYWVVLAGGLLSERRCPVKVLQVGWKAVAVYTAGIPAQRVLRVPSTESDKEVLYLRPFHYAPCSSAMCADHFIAFQFFQTLTLTQKNMALAYMHECRINPCILGWGKILLQGPLLKPSCNHSSYPMLSGTKIRF